jgi:putative hydrolase of the HAD superfamily
LLSDGWDHVARRRAADNFHLDISDLDARHHLLFETYENGKLTLEEYLGRVIFYREQPFSPAQFRDFMFAQSQPYADMIEMITNLKVQYRLKTLAVSNEGRELNAHRIQTFNLGAVVDAFVSSSFVHLRKPDADIFRLALDLSQTPVEQIVFIENTPMFVEVAQSLGIRSILHTNYPSTCEQLSALGLRTQEGALCASF